MSYQLEKENQYGFVFKSFENLKTKIRVGYGGKTRIENMEKQEKNHSSSSNRHFWGGGHFLF